MKQYLYISLAALVALVIGCTPKTTKEIIDSPVVKTDKPEEPKNPCTTFADLSPSERDQAETAYVLYKDFYDAKDYKEAYSYWKKAYRLAPGSNGRVKYQFDHGVGIYADFFKNTSDPKLQAAYVDTVMMIYDKRIECFGDEAYIQGRKAYDYYYNYPDYATDLKKYELFKAALDGKGKESDYFIINPMTKLLYDLFQQEKISLTEAQDGVTKLSEAISYGTANCDKDCAAWEVIKSYAPNRLEALEAVDDFYDCNYYSSKYFPEFEANSTDCETIQFVSRRMFRGKCDVNDTKMQQLKTAYTTYCYTPPPPAGPCSIANDLYNEGKYSEAVTKYEECLESVNDMDKKARYKLLIAKIYYRDLKNFSKARKFALEAASIKSNWGEPYMLIGKLYASSGPLCGPGTGWDSQIVTWPAIDKWEYAKSIDPSVAADASKLIAQYKKYMPNKEDVFIRSLKPGQTYKVPCWINENTKIRTSD